LVHKEAALRETDIMMMADKAVKNLIII
jgi:hypothetical protein